MQGGKEIVFLLITFGGGRNAKPPMELENLLLNSEEEFKVLVAI